MDLLGRTAANFFVDLNHMLHGYVLLNICRLTDPAKQFGNDNLTVHQVNAAMKAAGIPLSADAEKYSDIIHRHRDRIIDVRNKLLSHMDKHVIMNRLTLGGHTPEEGQEFLEALQGYCDEIGRAVGVGPLDFRYSPGPGDAIDLLTALDRADRLRNVDLSRT